MKKIVTAMGNPIIAQEIEKNEKFKLIAQDLQYQEAIFELMEENEIQI